MKPNQDIRDLIKKSPLKNYEVARALGYSSGSALSTKLQNELSKKDKKYFIQKITELSKKKVHNNIFDGYEFENIPTKENRSKLLISEVLKMRNQLSLEIDGASTKEDFEHISKIAKKIGEIL